MNTEFSLCKARRYLNRSKQHLLPLLLGNGGRARSDAEKGAALTAHLKNIFTPNSPTKTNLHFRVKKVARAIRELNSKKNYGHEQLQENDQCH